jgi:restriction system protein
MAVPEFYRFIRPSLDYLADGHERHWSEVEAHVSRTLGLSEADLREMLPSGVRTRVENRVMWSLTYLRQAGLISRPARGRVMITDRGLDYLRRAPAVVRPQDLEEFPEYVAFTQRTTIVKDDVGGTSAVQAELTPEDAMDRAFRAYDAALADEVLEAVKAMSPARFERLIVDLMLALGYGGTEDAGRLLGGTGDGGVDGVIDQDKLGLDKVYLQAKRWTDNVVGRKDVQAFVGALSGMGATKGVFITSSTFSAQAEAYARDNKAFSLSLVSGLELARLMIQNNIGVAMRQRYDLKRLDSDYFDEG